MMGMTKDHLRTIAPSIFRRVSTKGRSDVGRVGPHSGGGRPEPMTEKRSAPGRSEDMYSSAGEPDRQAPSGDRERVRVGCQGQIMRPPGGSRRIPADANVEVVAWSKLQAGIPDIDPFFSSLMPPERAARPPTIHSAHPQEVTGTPFGVPALLRPCAPRLATPEPPPSETPLRGWILLLGVDDISPFSIMACRA